MASSMAHGKPDPCRGLRHLHGDTRDPAYDGPCRSRLLEEECAEVPGPKSESPGEEGEVSAARARLWLCSHPSLPPASGQARGPRPSCGSHRSGRGPGVPRPCTRWVPPGQAAPGWAPAPSGGPRERALDLHQAVGEREASRGTGQAGLAPWASAFPFPVGCSPGGGGHHPGWWLPEGQEEGPTPTVMGGGSPPCWGWTWGLCPGRRERHTVMAQRRTELDSGVGDGGRSHSPGQTSSRRNWGGKPFPTCGDAS